MTSHQPDVHVTLAMIGWWSVSVANRKLLHTENKTWPLVKFLETRIFYYFCIFSILQGELNFEESFKVLNNIPRLQELKVCNCTVVWGYFWVMILMNNTTSRSSCWWCWPRWCVRLLLTMYGIKTSSYPEIDKSFWLNRQKDCIL